MEIKFSDASFTATTAVKVNKSSKFTVIDSKAVDQPAPKKKSESAAAAPVVEENLFVSSMSVEEKVAMAMSVGEETLTVEELTALFTSRQHPIVYDGFEPSGKKHAYYNFVPSSSFPSVHFIFFNLFSVFSGRMHIAQGVLRAINVNKLTSTGCLFKFWVADWFAQLNNKMDGDLKKIRMIGQYMIEIWKAIGEN